MLILCRLTTDLHFHATDAAGDTSGELIGQGLVREIRASEGSEAASRAALRNYSLGGEHSPVYDFCHEKVRSLVYDEITLARRRLLHRRTAEAQVARLRGQRGTGALAGQIAHHYEAAGNSALAADYFFRAGEYARSLYAHTEALAHFRAALALGHPDVAALQEAIGELGQAHPAESWVTFFEHIAQYERLYRALLGSKGSPWFVRKMREALGALIEERGRLPHGSDASSIHDASDELVPDLVSAMFVEAIVWWLERGRSHTPQEMATKTARLAAALFKEAHAWQ